MALRNSRNLASQSIGPAALRQFLLWAPVVVGITHQFLMLFFGIDSIYVFVDPPGSITPLASLEWQWWIVLLFSSASVAIAAYSDRLSIPSRIVVPTYAYALFLLLLIKPV